MGITEILRRIWLFSANKIKKNSEPLGNIQLNSSLQHIIVTFSFRWWWPTKYSKKYWMCLDWKWQMPSPLWLNVTVRKLCPPDYWCILHRQIWGRLQSLQIQILCCCTWYPCFWTSIEVPLLPVSAPLDDFKPGS